MRKLKFLLTVFMIISILLVALGGVVKAQTGDTKTLNIRDIRPSTNSKYVVETPNGSDNTIFKIGERIGTQLTFNDALYCLRSGVGFGNSAYVNSLFNVSDVVYTESFNLKTQASQVIGYYNRNFNYDIDRTNAYNAILWIIDNMYLPTDADAADVKDMLFENVLKFNKTGNVTRAQLDTLTDDDIEFIQQMALWYFSNYDENGAQDSLSLGYLYKLSNATKINGNSLSETKQKAVDALYEYFINSAILNSGNYQEDAMGVRSYVKSQQSTLDIDTNSMNITTLANSFTVVGPISITAPADINYSLKDIKLQDNNGTVIPEKENDTPIIFISSDASTIAKVTETRIDSLEEAIGLGEFYITIPNMIISSNGYDVSNVTLNPEYIEYNNIEDKYRTTATLWLAGNSQQPVLRLEREKNIKGNFNVVLEKRNEQGTLLYGASFELAREDGSRITIINNGDGTFSSPDFKITENGESFIFELEELSAPTGYIKIDGKIKIKVTTKINNEGTAYVLDTVQFINAEGTPITIDGVTFEVVNNTIKIKVVNEKIKEFDMALRKYITKMNGAEVAYTREPNIETANLENASETTAEYKHRKNAIIAKPNDEITYNISVYNEGNIDGIVTEIVDYLPEGIEYDPALNTELEDNYLVEYSNNTISIKPKAGEYLFKLNAYDETKTTAEQKLDVKTIEIVCRVSANNKRTDQILTNIATMKYAPADAAYIDKVDRDSKPLGDAADNFTLPSENDLPSYKGNTNNKENLGDDNFYYEGQEDDDDFDKIIIRGVQFDLALRKNITKINGNAIDKTKEPNINVSELENASETTAEYKHRKDAIEVKPQDKVTYKISVYNEGEISGIVTEIIDYLPEGLEYDATLNTELEDNYTIVYENNTISIKPKAGDLYLFRLNAYDESKTSENEKLDVHEVEVVCKVTAQTGYLDKVLTNIATMKYAPADAINADITDRDSKPLGDVEDNFIIPNDVSSYKGNTENKDYLGDSTYFYKGQEDDDDFDKIVIPGTPFDLSLRKFITKVNGKEITSRIPIVDTSKLNTIDETTGMKITTAQYTHSKDPVTVKKGDIVTYTIRVYNEGEIDGYVTKIADYLPEGLGYIMNYKENTNNFWVPAVESTTEIINLVGEEGIYKSETAVKNLKLEDFDSNRITSLSDVKIITGKAKISSSALEFEKIKAYNPTLTQENVDAQDNWQKCSNGTDGLYYRDVEITCIVLAENTFKGQLVNIAEIEEHKPVDENDNPIPATDRDSTPNNVETENEDDDDYEVLELRYFDLALRKFITAVNSEEINTRIPEPTIKEDGTIEYVHDKTPIRVTNSDVVTYTIRVYNEGTVLGYAMEISDDIPNGLEFLPENETNKQYKWVMLDSEGKETEDVSKAVEIRTKYLENSLLKPFDPTKDISTENTLNPDYAEVKVTFKVVDKNITQSDRIIINKAQITKDKAVDEDGNILDLPDEDSIPDEWNEGEDDQDIEKIYVLKFDLALLKWVTKTIVEVDNKTTTTETGFTPFDDPEPIAKVVIDKKKLNKTTVKFVYNIRIYNQGEIAGYATEITDYIPAGLEFYEEDNPLWKKDGEGKITTRALEGTLLQPGETATVEVTFRWKKDANNLGIKTNIAEISEDYNDKGSPDIDSTPDNVKIPDYDKQQEDDDDKALVMLELKTGGFEASYLWLGLTFITIIAGGVFLIKKYVI